VKNKHLQKLLIL